MKLLPVKTLVLVTAPVVFYLTCFCCGFPLFVFRIPPGTPLTSEQITPPSPGYTGFAGNFILAPWLQALFANPLLLAALVIGAILAVILAVRFGWALLFRWLPRLIRRLLRPKSAVSNIVRLRKAYESEVRSLADRAVRMRREGATPEQIARTLHNLRRQLGVKYKDMTPSDILKQIYERNTTKYGGPLGPSIDWLRNVKGASWEDIIKSASTPGGADIIL
jgi:hypothetical protein